MNDFFTNLVGRHLGTCDTIQPRTLGRFEAYRGRVAVPPPDEGTNPVVSEKDRPIDPRSTFSVEAPKVTTHEADPVGDKKDYPSPSLLEQSDPSAQLGLTEQQAVLSDSHVLPRQPYRGRVAVASPDEGTNPVVSAGDQTLQRPNEAKRDHPIDPRSAFSVEAPKVTIHEPDPIGNKKDYSSPSLPEQSDPSTQPGLTEQQAVLSDSHVLPWKPYDTQPLDADRYSHLGALEQEQPNKTALVVEEHDAFSDEHVQTIINESHEVTRDKNPPSASRIGEHYLENELNHRIRAMLQRLADDLVSPITEPAPDDRGRQKNESLISLPPEKKAPLLDATVASLDPAPTLEQEAGRQERISADDRENTALYGWLEPPSWLPEIEAQFNQRLQEKEAKAEPVINVTIGRVEVRAVQTETPKSPQHSKKPTGVMPLEEYLRRREGRGQR